MFFKISQNSQENTCAIIIFNKIAGLRLFLKRRLWHRCFPVNFVKFLKTLFLKNTSSCFDMCKNLNIPLISQILMSRYKWWKLWKWNSLFFTCSKSHQVLWNALISNSSPKSVINFPNNKDALYEAYWQTFTIVSYLVFGYCYMLQHLLQWKFKSGKFFETVQGSDKLALDWQHLHKWVH